MTQFYSDPEREDDPHALPDCEVFYAELGVNDEYNAPGWYYWFCFPGCLPDSDPFGPFETEADAIAQARDW